MVSKLGKVNWMNCCWTVIIDTLCVCVCYVSALNYCCSQLRERDIFRFFYSLQLMISRFFISKERVSKALCIYIIRDVLKKFIFKVYITE